MFKPKKSFSHHRPHSHDNAHRSQSEKSHEYAGHGSYEHDFHGHKEFSYKHGQPDQDFHEDEACQRCPYKRKFDEHFQLEHNRGGFHGHHYEGGFPHPGGGQYTHGKGQHHSHSEQSPEAMRFEDGSLQCMGCPNECIMRVTDDGKVEGNHCPRGAEAAKHLKE